MVQTDTKGRIVIVEDEAVIAMDLEERLRSNGYEVLNLCPTGEDALRVLSHSQADLVLMDVHLPGHIDGIETSRQANSLWRIPTVYLTAYSDHELVSRAARTNPLGYLVKPVRDRELFAAVEVALHRSRMNRRLQESDQWLAETFQPDVLACLVFDTEGRVLYADERSEQYLRFSRGELLGMPIGELITIRGARADIPLPMCIADATADDTRNQYGTGDVRRSDGSTIAVTYALTPLMDSSGRPLGLVLTLRAAESGSASLPGYGTGASPVIHAPARLTRIVVLSRDPFFRRGLLDVVHASTLVRIVAEVQHPEDLGRPELADAADVALIDARQFDEAPPAVWASLERIAGNIPLLFMTAQSDGNAVRQAVERGHSCLVVTTDHVGPLIRACSEVAAGRVFLSPGFLPLTRKGGTPAPPKDLSGLLSHRELSVFRGIQSGKPLKAIAAEMNLSTKTVSTYRRRVLTKLGLRSNADLVLYPSTKKPS